MAIPGQCHYPREADRTDKPAFVRAIDVSVEAAKWVCARSVQALYGADRQIGETLDELRRLGELANTVVVLTSDNGIQVGAQHLSRKWVAYDPSVRVPLLLKGPGVPAGRDGRLVGLIDVLPTVLGLLGIPARTDLKPLDGVSLLSTYRRPYLLLQYHQDPHTDEVDLIPTWYALTFPDGAKYVKSTTHGSPLVTTWREYYASDAVDPREATNLLLGGRANPVQGNGLPYTPRLDGLLGTQLTCRGHVTTGGTCR